MGPYDIQTRKCPYCGNECEADHVDVGVGMVQCGPYHCYSCGASEIGPEISDWYYKDRDGGTLFLPGKRKYVAWAKKKIKFETRTVMKAGHPFNENELRTGFYDPEKKTR